jgi:enterochelin esterase-like enzyme
MRKVFALVVMALWALSSSLAVAGEIRSERIASASLSRELPYLVYIPDGYADGLQRYPVLYLLHGAGGDETAWTGLGRVKETADRLMTSGAIPPSIIVMPGCPACWWVDGAKDKAETAFWSDLVPAIDSLYRTIKSRDGRVIAGVSAGGFGAVRFGLKYADKVAAVAGLSPAVYAETPPAMSSARKQPPFLKADGTFNDAAWAAQNYPSLLPAYSAQKQRIGVYLTTGDGDRLGIAYETALLHKRLFELQPELAELRVLDGEHTWALWSAALADAMVYVFRYTTPRMTMADTARNKPASDTAALSKPE